MATRDETNLKVMAKTFRLSLLLAAWAGLMPMAIPMTWAADEPSLAPDFALKTLTRDNLRLSEMRGQVVLLGFWARWCGDCRQAMQALQEINEKYQRAGLVTLGINVDDSLEQSTAMASALGLKYPVLVDESKVVSALYRVESMPLLVLVDREGVVRYRQGGFATGDQERLATTLRQLLNE